MDEFISTYAESERLKLERMDPAEIEALHAGGTERKNIKAVPLTGRAGSGSPKMGAQRSPKAGGGTSVYLGSPKMKRNNSGTAFKKF